MRFLFQLKCLVLCATFLCLAHGRIHFYSWRFEKHFSQKTKKFGKQDRLYGEDGNGSILLKRKHKPKGRPLAEPQITEVSILRLCDYNEFNISLADGGCSTPVQKAHYKRGPPAASLFS